MGEPPARDMDPVITDYYDRAPEEARLEQGPFRLEEARTRERTILSAGLALTGVSGLEGPGWILPDVPERMADHHRRAALLGVARMLETEAAVLGSSAHLLAVAQRPT